MRDKKIAVVIPCYNEEATVAKVVGDFRAQFLNARIVVIDNNSSDQTRVKALEAGADVFFEKKQGKGYAVQKAFNEFSEDIMVLVDGDDTYFAQDAKKLVKPVLNEEADMVVGNRIHGENAEAFKKNHYWGNKFLTKSLNLLFGTKLCDMQSGLRVMNRKFINSTALLAGGFSIEPEMTIQAIEKDFVIKEMPISLQSRKQGSDSKISTTRDGTIALYTLISLFRDYKPLHFFTSLSVILTSLGIMMGIYSLEGYPESGLVKHMPTLIVACFMLLAGFVSFVAGLILSSVKRRHDELLVILGRNDK
jgi:glycosyltransferase involved in cell wall biosynthesis